VGWYIVDYGRTGKAAQKRVVATPIEGASHFLLLFFLAHRSLLTVMGGAVSFVL